MGTIADKLAKLNTTKEELKAALAEKGQTVGEVFSTYPAAVRAIETGGGTTDVSIKTGGRYSAVIRYSDGEYSNQKTVGTSSSVLITVLKNSIIIMSWEGGRVDITGDAENLQGGFVFVRGSCTIELT